MTINNWGSDDPIEATKGGTAQSTYSKGDILYASASNTLSKLAIGSDNHVLTLASGSPSWAAAAGGSGGWVPLVAFTASSSANINFDSTYITSTYDVYVIEIFNMKPASNMDFELEVSPDNGSTMRTAGYASECFRGASSTTVTNTGAIQLTSSDVESDTSTGHGIFTIYIANASDSGVKTCVFSMGGYWSIEGSAAEQCVTTFGLYDTAETHNYIRIQADTGNLNEGEFHLYGLAKS